MAAAKVTAGVVARGHTVMIDGKPVPAGEKVSLSEGEIKDLILAGFLVDEKSPLPELSNGPRLLSEGPSVKRVA